MENEEEIMDLKQRAVALKAAGDTQSAKELLEKARELEFQNVRPEDLDDPLRLKQYAISRKKQGELELARHALKKAQEIEKELGLDVSANSTSSAFSKNASIRHQALSTARKDVAAKKKVRRGLSSGTSQPGAFEASTEPEAVASAAPLGRSSAPAMDSSSKRRAVARGQVISTPAHPSSSIIPTPPRPTMGPQSSSSSADSNGTNSTVDYNSRTANNRVSVLSRNHHLVFQGLVANVIYFVGTCSFVAFATLELNGRERDAAALVTYTIAFVCFLFNALGELYIDLTHKKRGVRHGRYSKKAVFNRVISILLVIGTILDFVAFFLWIERKFVQEHRLLYASSHFWLLSAILVLVEQIPIVDTSDWMEGLDDGGNILFFVGCVIDCFVRYLDTDIESGSPPLPVARLEFSSAPVFLISAFCYTMADGLRVRKIDVDMVFDPPPPPPSMDLP